LIWALCVMLCENFSFFQSEQFLHAFSHHRRAKSERSRAKRRAMHTYGAVAICA